MLILYVCFSVQMPYPEIACIKTYFGSDQHSSLIWPTYEIWPIDLANMWIKPYTMFSVNCKLGRIDVWSFLDSEFRRKHCSPLRNGMDGKINRDCIVLLWWFKSVALIIQDLNPRGYSYLGEYVGLAMTIGVKKKSLDSFIMASGDNNVSVLIGFPWAAIICVFVVYVPS